MPSLPCRNDPLVVFLNSRGYHPVVLPRSNLEPPEIYTFSDDTLRRWGKLAPTVPPGSLPTKPATGSIPGMATKQSARKHSTASASFLGSALQALGIGGGPAVDLGFANAREYVFSFSGVSYRSVDPQQVAAALAAGFKPTGLPEEAVRLGQVFVAYDYAYAGGLLMRTGGKWSAGGKLKGMEVEGFAKLGAAVEAGGDDGITITFKARAEKVAFAVKVGQVKKAGRSWTFNNMEVPRLGLLADEAAPAPVLMRKGEILVVEDQTAS